LWFGGKRVLIPTLPAAPAPWHEKVPRADTKGNIQ
jgi:hypothetical protein